VVDVKPRLQQRQAGHVVGDKYVPIFIAGQVPLAAATNQLHADIPDLTGKESWPCCQSSRSSSAKANFHSARPISVFEADWAHFPCGLTRRNDFQACDDQ
jgi:hypothetical protein